MMKIVVKDKTVVLPKFHNRKEVRGEALFSCVIALSYRDV